jgi:hypothetical protein
MKWMIGIALIALPWGVRADDESRWRYEDSDKMQRTFTLNAGSDPRKLLVDNISGEIHVTGYTGSEIRMNVTRRNRAESQPALAEAKRDVKLDVSQQGNFVRLYVDGPFRNNNGINYRGDDYYGYRVYFEYELQVPMETELILKTLNSAIAVKKSSGDFEVHTLNGAIDMEEISGSGTARTLNGKMSVAFTRNPTKKSEFHTLNGSIDVYFQPKLDADLHFKTLNGGVWSDFDVAPLSSPGSSSQDANWKFIYRSDRNQRARAGSGGPELSFDTLNGPIRLHSKAL